MEAFLQTLRSWPLPVLILATGTIWGVTNPLLTITSQPSKDTAGAVEQQRGREQSNFLTRLLLAFVSWFPFLCVFGVNQIGSLFNIILLGVGDLSVVSPLTNTVAFLTTAVIETFIMHKRKFTFKYIIGLASVCFGTYLALTSKA